MRIDVKIEGLDQLRSMAQKYPALFRRASKSAGSTVGLAFTRIAKDEGWRGRQLLGWPERSPYTGTIAKAKPGRMGNPNFLVARQHYKRTKRNYYEADTKRMHRPWLSGARNPYGKLINALRYRNLVAESGVLKMGYLEGMNNVEVLAKKAAQGFTIRNITSRMRRFFFALHLPLVAGKSEMIVPPRPFIGRVWRRHSHQMISLYRTKFYENLNRYRGGGFVRKVKGNIIIPRG